MHDCEGGTRNNVFFSAAPRPRFRSRRSLICKKALEEPKEFPSNLWRSIFVSGALKNAFLMSSTLHSNKMKNFLLQRRNLSLNFILLLFPLRTLTYLSLRVSRFSSFFFILSCHLIRPGRQQPTQSILLLSQFYVNQFNFRFIVIPGRADAASIFNEVNLKGRRTSAAAKSWLSGWSFMVACNIYTRWWQRECTNSSRPLCHLVAINFRTKVILKAERRRIA